jgi:molecular chaperone GrpE
MLQNNKENMEDLLENQDLETEEQEKDQQEKGKSIEQEKQAEEQDNQDDVELKIQEKVQEYEERLVRLQAEFENYRKRTVKEKEDIYKFASEDLVKNLLPVLDNFERALDSMKENQESNEGYQKGIDMVYQQLIQALEKEGLEEIKALGEPFDPNYHHAVFQESNEDYKDNTVMEVFQKGYTLKDKVIRPSMVKVCIH